MFSTLLRYSKAKLSAARNALPPDWLILKFKNDLPSTSKLASMNMEETKKAWDNFKNVLFNEHPDKFHPTAFESNLVKSILHYQYKDPIILRSLRLYFLDQHANNEFLQPQYCMLLIHIGKEQFIDEARVILERLILDPRMANHPQFESCIQAFEEVNRECFLLVHKWLTEKLKFSNHFLKKHVILAIKHELFDEAFSILNMEEMSSMDEDIITNFLLILTAKDHPQQVKWTFLNHLEKSHSGINQKQEVLMLSLLRSLGLQAQFADIENKSCANCEFKLKTLKNEELQIMRKCVYEMLTKKFDNQYMNTANLNEIKKLEKLISKHKETKYFDLVIDGLNIAYMAKNKFSLQRLWHECGGVYRSQADFLDSMLTESISALLSYNPNYKILIVGRIHMRNWNKLKNIVKQNYKRTQLFLVEKRTKDDLFSIYAAVCGKDTILISGDEMREHYCNLKKEHKDIFKRFFDARLYNPGNKKMNPGVSVEVNIDDKSVHVPVIVQENDKPVEVDWICATKKK